MKRFLTLSFVFLLGLVPMSAQPIHTVEELSSSIFSPTVTTEVFPTSNGLTYFVEIGQLQGSATLIPGNIIWADGTQGGSYHNPIQAMKGALGVADSVLVLVNGTNELSLFTPSVGVLSVGVSFSRFTKLQKYGSEYYFAAVALGETQVSVWQITNLGIVTRMANLPNSSTSSNTTMRMLESPSGLLIGASRKLYLFEPNAMSVSLLYTFPTTSPGIVSMYSAQFGGITYFLVDGTVYQTDGTMTGTLAVNGLPSGRVLNLCTYQSKLIFTIMYSVTGPLHTPAPVTAYYKIDAVTFDGNNILMRTNVFDSEYPLGYNASYDDMTYFRETSDGKLYMLAGDYFKIGGTRVKLFQFIAPDSLSQDLFNSTTLLHKLMGLYEVDSRLVFGVGGIDSGLNSTFNSGYFELEMTTNTLSQLKFERPVQMAMSNSICFGVARGRVQRLLLCNGTPSKPRLSHMNVDKVGTDIMLSWTDSMDVSTTRYDIYQSSSPFPGINSSLYGSVFIRSVAASNGRRDYAVTIPQGVTNRTYFFSIVAVSSYGRCSDTVVRVGKILVCPETQPFPATYRVLSNQMTRTTNVTFQIIENAGSLVDNIVLFRNGTRLTQLFRSATGSYSYVDASFDTLDVYSIQVFTNDSCRSQWTSVIPSSCYASDLCNNFYPTVTGFNPHVGYVTGLCPRLLVDVSFDFRAPGEVMVYVNGILKDRIQMNATGAYHYLGDFPASVDSTYNVTLRSVNTGTCPDFNLLSIPNIVNSAYYFTINNFSAVQTPARNQMRISWDVPNANQMVRYFELYRDGTLWAYKSATSLASDSYVMIDSFTGSGAHEYIIRTASLGDCEVGESVMATLVCDSLDRNHIYNINIAQLNNHDNYISWSVSNRRGRPLTKAFVVTARGTDSLIVSLPTSNTSSSYRFVTPYLCTDNQPKQIKIRTANAENTCRDDEEIVICNCGSFRQAASYAYPNPAHTQSRVVLSELSDADISLFDVNGSLMREFNNVTVGLDIDLQGLPRGVYFLAIRFDTRNEVVRLIVN